MNVDLTEMVESIILEPVNLTAGLTHDLYIHYSKLKTTFKEGIHVYQL